MAVIGGGAAAAAAARLGIRDDPYFGYNFLVEIQGMIAGGFSEVSGLRINTSVESMREGGVNTHEYKLPGQTSYGDLVLRRGVSDVDLLWHWYQDVIDGKISRRNGTIYLMNHVGIPLRWWNFVRAYPTAWEGPEFNATSPQIAVQSLTLVHEGLLNPRGF
ncbi:phage tail protein [Corallococcus exercitus]|uniref:phage tail protein n=1 Tax=Corallococcus exercitus TaxID=2316736 RepID=UPI000EA3324F|nr:phage tail protein [Corallococcus exercitus]RKG72385.1 phage tail protein [Corallococcus exercitus]